ncbi:MAG: CapA family protein [Fimbriimonadaceae bacterium]
MLLAVESPWSIVLCGDIMLNGVPPTKSPFADIAPSLHRADLTFANLEVPLTGIGVRTRRKSSAELKARTQFILRANPAHMRWLRPAGISAVSLGNNHAMDYGPDALAAELAGLDRAGVKHAGAGPNKAAASAVAIMRLPSGLRVGLVSGLAFVGAKALGKCTPATAGSAGVNALDLGGQPTAKRLRPWLMAAHKRCDVLIVAVHGGIERHPFPTAYQVSLAHALINAGADVVWGHHPHVLEGAELYEGHPILYSMGNLVSPMPGVGGLVRLTFSGAVFQSAGFLPTRIARGRVKLERGRSRRVRESTFRRLCAQTAVKVHGTALPLAAE